MLLKSGPLTAVQIIIRNGKLLQQGPAVMRHVDTTVSRTNSIQGLLSFAIIQRVFLYVKVKCFIIIQNM